MLADELLRAVDVWIEVIRDEEAPASARFDRSDDLARGRVILETVPSPELATQTAPSLCATPLEVCPTGIFARARPVCESWSLTSLLGSLRQGRDEASARARDRSPAIR
jgi:hypothetical protein